MYPEHPQHDEQGIAAPIVYQQLLLAGPPIRQDLPGFGILVLVLPAVCRMSTRRRVPCSEY